MRLNWFQLILLSGLASLFGSCSASCNGRIEATVLYFAEGPNKQGQLAYVNVQNEPKLGTQQTLMRADKEFGTFPHVVIIADPQMKFKDQRTICFDTFVTQAPPPDIDLRERDIPRIAITK